MLLIPWTPGRLCLVLSFLISCWSALALSGACLSWLVEHDIAFGADRAGLWARAIAVFTALAGVFYYRHQLGQPGWRGLARSLLVQSHITLMTALIAGSIVLPVMGTLYAPIVTFQLIFFPPITLLKTLAYAMVMHVLMRVWTQERPDAFERRLWAFSL